MPQDLKLDDSKQGIKRGEQSKSNIIIESASYAETLMKILLTVKPEEPISEHLLNDLFVVNEAHIRYLQEERALVLVNSSLGENVGGIYRHLCRNTSAFPPEALDALTAAVSLSAANQQPHRTHQPARGRGYSSGFNQRSSFRQPRWRGSRVPFSRDHAQPSAPHQDFQPQS